MAGEQQMVGAQLDGAKNAYFPSPLLDYAAHGASIALVAAAAFPDRFAGLVLMAPHVIVEPCTLAGIAAAGEAKAAERAAELAPKADKIENAKSIGLKLDPADTGGGKIGTTLAAIGATVPST